VSPSPEWQGLLSAPRHANATLSRGEIPRSPGVYAWFQDGECVYVGKATSLRERLSKHRSTSLDLSRSTLRATVAATELGITRSLARSRPTVMTPEQIAVVSKWFSTAEVSWRECQTQMEADTLERRLRSSWMPVLNLI
jgi:GIY-YIG catalytic domain